MRAIQVTCPQCGAALRVQEGAETVTCEYCNTVAAVQRRSRIFERVMAPPRPPGVERMAVQRRSGGVLITIISMAMIGGVVAGIAVVTRRSRPAGAEPPSGPVASGGATAVGDTPRAENPPSWEGTGGILLVDLDGDGGLDVVGRSRAVQDGDFVSLVALDGKTGARRWQTVSIGTYTDTYQGVLAIGDGTVLFSDQRARLSAWEVATGAARWSVQQPERAAGFCTIAGDEASVVVVGTDEVRRPIALATGVAPGAIAEAVPDAKPKPKPAHGKKPPCTALPTDKRRDRDPGGGDSRVARRLGWWGAAIAVAPDGGRFAVGQRDKGTHVPQIAGLDDKGAARWSVDLPTDPLGADEREPALFAVSALGPCATYTVRDGKHNPRLACFAAADGARLWDVELLDDNPLEGIAITPAAIYVSMWNLLEAHDPATGAVLWTYGWLPH